MEIVKNVLMFDLGVDKCFCPNCNDTFTKNIILSINNHNQVCCPVCYHNVLNEDGSKVVYCEIKPVRYFVFYYTAIVIEADESSLQTTRVYGEIMMQCNTFPQRSHVVRVAQSSGKKNARIIGWNEFKSLEDYTSYNN